MVLVPLTVALLVGCVGLTAWQVRLWHNSTWLWEYTVQVTQKNWLAHHNLGVAYLTNDRLDLAREQFFLSLEAQPRFGKAHSNLGVVFLRQGNAQAAAAHCAEGARLEPEVPRIWIAWGQALAALGKDSDATERFREAVRLDPQSAGARSYLAQALARQGNLDEAIAAQAEAVRLDPSSAGAHNALGVFHAQQGDWAGAVASWRRALELASQDTTVLANLAWGLQRKGETTEAAALYRRVVESDAAWLERTNRTAWTRGTDLREERRDPEEACRLAEQVCAAAPTAEARYLDTLGAAYAEAGRFDEAAAAACRALQLATRAGETVLASDLRHRLSLYRERKPFRAARED
jgi:Flp pilus assembly protein TadD